MKFTCKELSGQSFETKQEMFAALKASKEAIIKQKTEAVKFSDHIDYSLKEDGTLKQEDGSATQLKYGDYVYPIINSTNYLDSHSDLHLYGIWDKSAEEQKGRIYFIINHDLSVGNVISYPKEVELIIKEVEWSKLGKSYPGSTQVLMFKAMVTEKSNPAAFYILRDKEDVQYSVRMRYVRLELAINDSSEYYKQEKAVFDKYLPLIVNQEKAIEDGYFWVIHEAEIYKEGSMVLFGSNDATATLYDIENKDIQLPNSTDEEPLKGAQNEERGSLLFNANLI
ncbi:hypothetical protein G7074_18155 [Pedobacter sp. HDW13]|uniref:hypothetical protein n=1 Tax=Pedobacter sp. HDW13 TaxID=2714940 RepID=UPI00140C125C|nr:hypothetical protein [Pedobacter sp. HDW13]QIL41018.1 hypothetical protein G7074_18155 [Pedobacter sp. HDW13]